MAQDAAARCAAKGSQARSVGRGSIRLARMAKQRKKFDEIYLQLKCRQVQRASQKDLSPQRVRAPRVCECLSHSLLLTR